MARFDISKVVMEYKYYINNIKGILYHKDTPLIDFEIKNTHLVYAKDLSNGELYPFEFEMFGLNYAAFNSFFNERVVRNHTQYLRDYLDGMGLRHYDMEELVKRMNGWNGVGYFWVKFDNIGAKCWNDIISQKYPI